MKGRPLRRHYKPGERVVLSLRVTPEMKAAIDRASRASGRSQAQEVELRLELAETIMIERRKLS